MLMNWTRTYQQLCTSWRNRDEFHTLACLLACSLARFVSFRSRRIAYFFRLPPLAYRTFGIRSIVESELCFINS